MTNKKLTVIIDRCANCPAFNGCHRRGSYCYMAHREIIKIDQSFPDWCPLEDAKEEDIKSEKTF